mgnify:CR=1 FL=1
MSSARAGLRFRSQAPDRSAVRDAESYMSTRGLASCVAGKEKAELYTFRPVMALQSDAADTAR